jgi:50S ribosomal subunit-associated GTPase HflX
LQRDTVTAGETELEMAVRHVAEQIKRIARQEALIERLREVAAPSDEAVRLLAAMHGFLEELLDHVARLSK